MRRRASFLGLILFSAAVVLPASTGALPAGALGPSTQTVAGMRGLSDIWCTADGSCLGVGYTAEDVGAVVVLRAVGPNGPVRVVPGTSALWEIACHGGGRCIAVGRGTDGGGVVVELSLDGSPGAVRPVPGAWELFGVACPTATTCLATGTVLNTLQPAFLYPTTFPVFTVISNSQPAAAQRFPRGTSRMIGIACPTATTCLSTGSGIAVMTDAGATWNARVTSFAGSLETGYPTDAISCPSPTTCFTTAAGFVPADEGYIGVPAMATVSASGVVGPVQRLGTESGNASDISCVNVRACTVVGQANLAVQGLVIDVSRFAPSPTIRSASVNAFFGVSCVAAGSCGIVGSTATTAVFAWHGPTPA